ncbi:MAG: hypothetical protein C0405_03665, partial [Desulfovibrio sp.]|nr:hypothetical protein [Desulfovibrio sp.]
NTRGAIMPLRNWRDISGGYTDTLLLGNGASCAISYGFNYSSLLNVAVLNRFINSSGRKLFELMGNNDFEMAIRIVDESKHVFDALNVRRRNRIKLNSMRNSVKDALIKSVGLTHATAYADFLEKRDNIVFFCQNFRTIFSINYDLLLYWMMMYAMNHNNCRSQFKDCFQYGQFVEDYEYLRQPLPPFQSSTLVFYPHGHLALLCDRTGRETKISANGNSLVGAIAGEWERNGNRPLFVSEGDTASKLLAIDRSHYLRCTLQEINNQKESVAIYGWSMSQQDTHLIEAICNSGTQRIAISIHETPEEATQLKIVRARGRIIETYARLGRQLPIIEFYRADSPGCWCYQDQ